MKKFLIFHIKNKISGDILFIDFSYIRFLCVPGDSIRCGRIDLPGDHAIQGDTADPKEARKSILRSLDHRKNGSSLNSGMIDPGGEFFEGRCLILRAD